jgi:putative glycosyltransferase
VRLSIVTTLYQSASTLDEFHRRAAAAAAAMTADYEIVFVVDGSPDRSLAAALALQVHDPHVVVVDLSRNFGHHPAMMAGLAHASGELVFLVDSDLEESPEWLAAFERARAERGVDVVYGVQASRQGSPVTRLGGWLFYTTVNLMLDHPIPRNVLTARLMTRRYVRALLRHRERLFAIAGLWTITGFEQAAMVVTKSARDVSAYRLGHRVAVMMRVVTSFSARPLVYVSYLGLAISAVALALTAYFTAAWFLWGRFLAGWLSVFLSVWLLGGLIIFCIGVVGIYVSHVFVEAKRRPVYLVRELYRRRTPDDSASGAAT